MSSNAQDPLAASYGVDRVVAIARDSNRLFILWELTAAGAGIAKDSLGGAAVQARLILRVADGLGATRDIEIDEWLGQRTVTGLRSGGSYVVALGWFAADCFVPVAMSRPTALP